jgi:cobalt-zinc-cadmium efflux system outer membrane protein
MTRRTIPERVLSHTAWVCAGLVAWLVSASSYAAAPPPTRGATVPLSQNDAVVWALQHNPDLASLRQQHGIAAAAVVIAQTYPFNPLWENRVRAAFGPQSAGITNSVPFESLLLIDVEVRGQGRLRREGASHALQRTDWEIAYQEVALAIRVLRAYSAVLYRLEKLQVIQKTIAVNERALKQVMALIQGGKLREADRILIQTELDDVRAQLASGYTMLVPSWHELRRALGLVEESFRPQGVLTAPARSWDAGSLVRAALERRPDLHAREAAVAEAEARVRLAVADRYGNPQVGAAYEYDPSRINMIGTQFTVPLPIFNSRRGEILQREAERSRAMLELRQTEVLVRQDVRAALARLQQARAWLKSYQERVLPGLEAALKRMNQLLEAGEPGVSAVQLIDINRKLLRAQDLELDARWETVQAAIDLAAGVGEPALVVAPDAMGKTLGLQP